MSRALRTAAALAAAATVAACGNDEGPEAGLLLAEPSDVAAFHGLTPKHAAVHPYLAIANTASNDLTLVDAVDDSVVLAPVPLRSFVFPAPGRPALLASARLGDDDPALPGEKRPDLLIAVSAGDSRLQVFRTWDQAGGVAFDVPLGGNVLALVAIPSAPGTARVAAALSDERIAVAEFRRQAGGDAVEVVGVQEASGLGFQPVALAAMPDDPDDAGIQTALYAATRADVDGVSGVAELGVLPGTAPVFQRMLDAGAPTRLVAAARLREALGSAVRDATAFDGASAVPRVYAVLDESGCGVAAPIACGLVALDAGLDAGLGGGLVADPLPGTPEALLAPIPIPGEALALAAVPPPAVSPTPDPVYAGTIMRVQTAEGARATTGVAAVARTGDASLSERGAVQFVDLGRWELPSDGAVPANVRAVVSAPQGRVTTADGTTLVDQWLVLFDPRTSTTAAHSDAAGLAAAVEVTPGYTPTERWTVTYQGALPGLSSRRAHVPEAGALALQVPGAAGGFTEVVRLHDPTLGVAAGDTVVVEAPGLAGCAATFEAEVGALLAPTSGYPGGAVALAKKGDPAHPEWDACVDALVPGATGLRATFLAGGYVLVKGTGATAVHVGRPEIGAPFVLQWAPESAGTCVLPPAVPWPVSGVAEPCDAACREDCQELARIRMARRIGYVTETCGNDSRCLERWPALPDVFGPALGFTLALENPALDPPPRGQTLTIETSDGRTPFRVAPPEGVAIDPRAVSVYDRSPWNAGAGVRVLVPYASGVVLDATPTVQGGDPVSLR